MQRPRTHRPRLAQRQQQPLRPRRQRAQRLDHPVARRHVRVAAPRRPRQPPPRRRPRPQHPLADHPAALPRLAHRQLLRAARQHRHHQIDAIHQRPRQPLLIPLHRARRIDAAALRMPEVPARTRVHRRHQLKIRRQPQRPAHPHDVHRLVLERLPQPLEARPRELRQLIQKQQPAVRQAHLPRPHRRPAPEQPRHAHRVMRGPQRRLLEQPARDRSPQKSMHLRHLERRLAVEPREQPDRPPRQHRLARPRRPVQQQVVPARHHHLERPPGQQQPADVRHVPLARRHPAVVPLRPHVPRQHRLAAQVRHQLRQRLERIHHQPRDQRRLVRAVPRHRQRRKPAPPRAVCHHQRARGRPQRPVQRQLAPQHQPLEPLPRHHLVARQQRTRHRQVDPRTVLALVRRGQVHHLLARVDLVPHMPDRAAHPLARLRQRPARAPHDRQSREPEPDVGLDRHHGRVHASDARRIRSGQHTRPLTSRVHRSIHAFSTTCADGLARARATRPARWPPTP